MRKRINPRAVSILKARLAAGSLLDFMRYCWTSTVPLVVGRHTREICDRLTRAEADYRSGVSSYLIITVPFRHGKSEIVSRNFPPYFFGHNPDAEIILTTYGQTLSDRMSKDARRIMRSGEYSAVFPGVTLSAESASVQAWEIAHRRGKFQASGIGGSATGKGADLLILDDYLKGRAEAESQLIRDKQWNDFADNLMTRLSPVHIVVILATPWHVDDIIGRIKNRMNPDRPEYSPDFPHFEVLKYPARAPDGSYLFPERYPAGWYRTMFSALGAYSSAALLQCEPVQRGGNMFRVENIRIVESVPEDIRYCRFWDLASTAKERAKSDPDYTAGALVGVRKVSGEWHVYVKDLVYAQAEAPERNELIRRTSERDGASVQIGVESVAGYKDTYTTLRRIITNRVIRKIDASKDKVLRLSELEPPCEAGHIHLLRGRWNQALLDEFASFPAGTHDDKVDAVAGAFEMAKTTARGPRSF